ncbi:Homeoprotein, putative [Coccidioides posadasii C735 delta SOWgp]|uniref:Homeoprotein, putative n=1 Tax=Coccidioides posadasii (strain C735) TaxID=222929 RepID=C5PCU9_COCP7|nr:Homeoprotein, putative [Coccidioides posadasii C735 delta SOWgp]EER24910.1 Homeoprotein, putative [Coccidioides posadasii C735 delta SOWgp]|eukprot:XP_003067055.1 Homeoprotein, putative [Coccidioides posadasii C735 delta SOWgp]
MSLKQESQSISAPSGAPAPPVAPAMANAPTNSGASGPATSVQQQQQQQQQQRPSRRPPRKSTLTQQQKNHKRQRATQDQLVTLEMEFNKNPTPTAAVRERIAEEINMTERSVQIWFQNRRAKIKMIAKRGIETGEDCDSVPESMRQYLALHWDPSKSRNLFNRGYGSGDPMLNAPTSSSKIVISHFSCRSLRVGTWRRVGQNTMDLVIFYSPDKSCMTYYINNDSAGYKIEYPFSYIKNIALEPAEPGPTGDATPPKFGGIVIELNRPPNFYMDSSNSGGFYQCGDFTEDQQATKSLVHHLGGGHPKVLSVQLAKLVSLESFQNRHIHYGFTGFASAPVSPHIIHRPASQPNQMARRQSAIYQENHFGMGLHPPRGHKRQRSRSVPVPVDFSAMQTPMPSFHVQNPSTQFQPNPNIFAPVPQTHIPVNGVAGALQVDTSAGYNLDFHNYPMSAATASPPEFASPSLFATTAAPDQPQTTHLGAPYNVPFLSPSSMVDHGNVIAHSASPLSHVSQAEPSIADQSPPLTTTQRSSPAEMFPVSNDPASSLPDDGLLLSEMYSKQNLNVSMPSPPMDDTTFALTLQGLHDQGASDNGVDFHGMLSFDTVDPMSLGADS